MQAEERKRNEKVFRILAEDVETVVPVLVDGMLTSRKSYDRITYLTFPRLFPIVPAHVCRGMTTRYLTDEALYREVILHPLAKAKSFVWIGTADIKDLHVEMGKEVKPFLALLDGLVRRGVEIRLLHAKDPGPRFRDSFDKYPLLWKRMERQLCPRVHFKIIVADGVRRATADRPI
ncbi:MAG: hypothetical protein R2751_10245 [Bacteroidales bacterium]